MSDTDDLLKKPLHKVLRGNEHDGCECLLKIINARREINIAAVLIIIKALVTDR